jgi:ribonuclease HI
MPPQSLKIIQINLKHSAAASAALSHLIIESKYDIAIIQEPYLWADMFIPNVPDGFSSFHCLDHNHAYGALIWAKKSLGATKATGPNCNHLIGIQFPIQGVLHFFYSFYAQPSLANIYESLTALLASIGNRRSHLIIGSDANAKNTIWGSRETNQKGRYLESLCSQNSLNIANHGLGGDHFIPAGTSFIDVTLFGDKVNLRDWRYLKEPSCSDHPYISFEITGALQSTGKQKSIRVPSGKLLNSMALSVALTSRLDELKHSCKRIDSQDILDAAVKLITTVVSDEAMNCKVPKSNRCRTEPKTPWWNDELSAARCEARAAFKRWSKLRSLRSIPQQCVERSRECLKKLTARFQRLLRHFYNEFWRKHCTDDMNTNLLTTLRALARKEPQSGPPNAILMDGKLTTDPYEIATVFQQAFFKEESMSNHMQMKIQEEAEKFLDTPSTDGPEVTLHELKTALQNLKMTAAPGNDLLPADVCLIAAEKLQDPLRMIFNAVLRQGCFPSSWKLARISIIPKPNKPTYDVADCYRPISILPIFGKILERVILNRLKWHANEHHWFSPNQHGFREGKSTETASHQLISTVEKGFAEKKFTACVFLDIKSAFDSAWHPAIIVALRKRGCPDYLVKVVAAFLADRTGSIIIGDTVKNFDIEMGCPQGSVLSAFLWTALVEDVLNLNFPEGVLPIAFADDLSISCSDPVADIATGKVQRACNMVADWCESVKLSLNASKSNLILFDYRKRRTVALPASVTINDVKICSSSSTVYLGLVIDDRLSWKQHIARKCDAASRVMQMSRRYLSLTSGLNRFRLQSVYKAIVEPVLLYNCSVWAGALAGKLFRKSLRSTQRKMAQLITKTFRTAPTEATLILSGLLPIDYRIIEISALRCLEYESSAFCPSAKTLINKWLETHERPARMESINSFHLSKNPPWSYVASTVIKKVPKQPLLPLAPTDLCTVRAYTDGSVIGNGSGFAAVFVNRSGEMEILKQKLPPDTTIFQAESLALQHAIEWLTTNGSAFSKRELYSDALSVLNAATSTGRCTSTIASCRELLADNPDIELFWIPSHVGHYGNERADQLAKEAALFDSCSTSSSGPLSKATVKRKLRSLMRIMWNTEWQTCKSGRTTWRFLPTVATGNLLEKTKVVYQAYQIMSGHCKLNCYLHKFRINESAKCSCGADEETIEHFIFYCPFFVEQRRALKDSITTKGFVWPTPLETFTKSIALFKAFQTFLVQTKRLDLC